ncbi:MAG: type IV pilus assembly protein PilM [bacterium]|nr:type IV pilus assembly protein PilM [bacterium]
MRSNFTKKRAIGIDVSDFSVKVIGLEKKGNQAKIICFRKEEIPKDAIGGGEVKNEKLAREAIQKLFLGLREKNFNFKKGAVSLPEEKSFVDIIKLPALDEQEKIAEMVSLEAENVIPFPLSDVYFDFEKVETTAKDSKYQEVVLAACPKTIVDSYINIFQDVGFLPTVMEVESFSITRAITERDFFYSPFLLVDFGETRTTLAIFAGKNLRFTSTIQTSSSQLTKSIAAFLDISLTNAEELKQKEGLLGKKEAFEAMIPFLTDMTEQIKRYIDYYQTHSEKRQEFPDKKFLKKILLCGEGANLKGIIEFLSKETGIEVEKADPLINLLSKDLLPGFTKEKAMGFTTAIGLALRGLEAG